VQGFLAEHPGAFDPNEIRILVAAFDRAWESVQASGALSGAEAESARAIAAAKDGERDQGRLRDGALLALAQANLRTAPLSAAIGRLG